MPVLMTRPRVKPEHAPYRVAGGKIRIGGVSYGLAAELADPDGWVWTMLMAMDGTRDLPGIIEHVSRIHPGQPVAVLRRGAEQLLGTGYVEDVAAPVPAGLSDRDIRRHDRALGYLPLAWTSPRGKAHGTRRRRLSAARVTILGVGGTGGIAAMALAASGIGRLHCVDPDEVELSNLSRQIIYTEDDLGRPKAEAAVARLRRLNSDIEVTGERLEAASVEDVRAWPGTATCSCSAPTSRPSCGPGPTGPAWPRSARGSTRATTARLSRSARSYRARAPAGNARARLNRDSHADDGANVRGRAAPTRRSIRRRSARCPRACPATWPRTSSSPWSRASRRVPGRIETVNLAALDAPLALAPAPHPECPACGAARGPAPRRGPRYGPRYGLHAVMAAETAARLAPQAAADGSRIRLRPLSERQDGDGWVIGRTGDRRLHRGP